MARKTLTSAIGESLGEILSGAVVAGLALCLPAAAQQWGAPQQPDANSLNGAWSTGSNGQQFTVLLNPNGTFVDVLLLPNGSMERRWGVYRTEPMSATAVRLDTQVQGWLPHQICSHPRGWQRRCTPYQPPMQDSVVVQFTSANSFQLNGAQFGRDPSAQLLQRQVPDMVDNEIQAPVTPNIPQPVIPQLHPYQTPGGAGSVGAMRYDDEHQQPYRVCAVNNGTVWTDQNGVQHCSN